MVLRLTYQLMVIQLQGCRAPRCALRGAALRLAELQGKQPLRDEEALEHSLV